MENTCDITNLPYIYRAKNYRYIGGSYGKCSQKLMMKEIYENGPIVVSFEPDYNFMLYKSGIYHSIDEKTWINNGVPRPEWEKVDHSVLLVGWGEDINSGEKFWILQNTWGENWGENGFFRMKRGTDEFGIESICEAADPFIIKNNNFYEKKLKEVFIDSIDNNNEDLNVNNSNFLNDKNKFSEILKELNLDTNDINLDIRRKNKNQILDNQNDTNFLSNNSIFDELVI
jgi:C1A family cysteine protease